MKGKIQFLGGVAGEITGSCHLLTFKEGKKTVKILIDAGLIQGNFSVSLEKNRKILEYLRPEELEAVVITHSHIDHIGLLPFLFKNGFRGRVISTEGSAALLGPMLEDSAKIQVAESAYLQRKAHKNKVKPKHRRDSLQLGNYDQQRKKSAEEKSKNRFEPLYNSDDVLGIKGLVKNEGYDYHQWIRIAHGINAKFYPSGHVLGGAIIILRINTKPKDIYLCFTGDLGRRDGIILPPPEVVKEPIDHLIIESTYGGKTHPPREQEIKKFLEFMRLSVKNNLNIIIPSYTVERTQELVYLHAYHEELKDIPPILLYIDSPLGVKVTEVFSDKWTKGGMFSDQGNLSFNPFNTLENRHLQIITDQKESDFLATRGGSQIIVAGSGTCDAGRVRNHLRKNLGNPNALICLVGYMPQGSLGRKLKDGYQVVKMNGEEINIKAEIAIFDSFSAHADGPFLLDYAKAVLGNNSSHCQNVFIVHGENESAKSLKLGLESKIKNKLTKISIPKIYEERTIII